MNNKIVIAGILIFISLSCDSDTELKRSVFIEDKQKPGLPEYSEWGYNTFGAYYDRTPFTSNSIDAPAKFVVENGNTTFSLEGQKNYYEMLSIEFVLPDVEPQRVDDLITLHETTFNLTDAGVIVKIKLNGELVQVEILEGELFFKRGQQLVIDGEPFEVILSGNFNLKLLLNGNPVTFSEGRFDLGITEDNFFKLN